MKGLKPGELYGVGGAVCVVPAECCLLEMWTPDRGANQTMGTPLIDVPPNDLGLSKFAEWCNDDDSDPLEDQLAKKAIPFHGGEIPHLMSMAGNARLVFCDSQATGQPTTILVVPIRGIDWWAEKYYYFIGMDEPRALEDEGFWVHHYDDFERLVRAAYAERKRRQQAGG
jgi:hypothetical protein